MNFLVILCFTVVGFVNAISDDEVSQKWQIYQEQFDKTYRSPIEYRKRFAIFKDNLLKIEEHNSLYEQGKTTYTEGINQFTDWSEEEFLQYVNKGLVDKPPVNGDIFNQTGNFNSGSLDWRTAGIVTGVKNQGQCGSCWSFSSTGAIEGQLGRRGRLISLSEQNLMDCSRIYGNMGCGGGWMSLAFQYVRYYGILSEQDYPYRGVDENCKADYSRIVTRLSGYVSIPYGNEQSLQSALALKGPIAVGMVSTVNLQRYSGGIFYDSTCSGKQVNHAILAVGYGTENGYDYYILKNSWGTTWGERGYFRLIRNYNNHCGIANMAAYPVL